MFAFLFLERARKRVAVIAVSLLTGFLVACGGEPEPDFYRLITIDFEVEGERYSRSWNVSCTMHNTGAGGMYKVSYRNMGVRLPSGEAVLFFLPQHPCYDDWRPPFRPSLSDDPDQRLRQLYPNIFWLDDADNPSVIETSIFFEYLLSDEARVRVVGIELKDSVKTTVTNPAYGIGWIAKNPEERTGPEALFFDTAIIVSGDLDNGTFPFNQIADFSAGDVFSFQLAQEIIARSNLNVSWGYISKSNLIPNPYDKREQKSYIDASMKYFYYDGNTLKIVKNKENSPLLIRAYSLGEIAEINNIKYNTAEYNLKQPLRHRTGTIEAYRGVIVAEGQDILIVGRNSIVQHAIADQIHGD